MSLFSRRIEVPCTVEIEQTFDSLHAHATPEGVDIGPGDTVLVHGAPSGIAFGERGTFHCTATVIQAGWFARTWTQATALFELAELWHVGFEPKEAVQ